MVDRGRSITPATPAETVHELRKDAKKLRYLIECFGGLFEKGPRAAFVGRLKSLQDTLGEHQDAEVHAHALRTIADDPRLRWSADTLLAIGQLIERLEQRRTASRGELAERFAEFDRKQTRAALKELLASAGQADR
jgi:CHAD domain-containing protein